MTYDIKCHFCKRFLGTTDQSVDVNIKCSGSQCKEMNDVKVVFMSDLVKDKTIAHEHNVVKD